MNELLNKVDNQVLNKYSRERETKWVHLMSEDRCGFDDDDSFEDCEDCEDCEDWTGEKIKRQKIKNKKKSENEIYKRKRWGKEK